MDAGGRGFHLTGRERAPGVVGRSGGEKRKRVAAALLKGPFHHFNAPLDCKPGMFSSWVLLSLHTHTHACFPACANSPTSDQTVADRRVVGYRVVS